MDACESVGAGGVGGGDKEKYRKNKKDVLKRRNLTVCNIIFPIKTDVFMENLDLLLDAGFYNEALECLHQYGEPSSNEYLFYLGFIQAHLGWTEEAIQTLTKYKMKEKDRGLISTTSGLLADIYHNERMLFDAVSEISKALVIEPDCSLIQKKAEEILDDLNHYYSVIAVFLIGLLMMNTMNGGLYVKYPE